MEESSFCYQENIPNNKINCITLIYRNKMQTRRLLFLLHIKESILTGNNVNMMNFLPVFLNWFSPLVSYHILQKDSLLESVHENNTYQNVRD